ncbi:MAG: LapA family protein [Phycisphaerae bacterium]|nr:LapA family protein [Phycisphaerae bacterium]
MMVKVRIILVSLVLIGSLIVILQNTQVVDTRLLFMTISMPRALLLIITFVAGFVTGTLFGSGFLKRSGKQSAKDKG